MTDLFNFHEQAARAQKAASLVLVVSDHLTADEAADAPVELRCAFADEAGVFPPSEKTWALVVSLLRKREELADPFEGVKEA